MNLFLIRMSLLLQIAIGILLITTPHVSAQRRNQTAPVQRPSVRIPFDKLNTQTAIELITELDQRLSKQISVDIIEGHQDHSSSFDLLLESPVHDLLRDRGLISIEPGPSGRANLRFTASGEKLFFSARPPTWATPHLPSNGTIATGDLRRRLTISIARPVISRVGAIEESVSGKMERVYQVSYQWKYAKTEPGRDLNSTEEEFTAVIGLVHRNGRWQESYDLPEPPNESNTPARRIAAEGSSFDFGCSYPNFTTASIDITRTPLALSFVIPAGDCWTPWLDLHSRSAEMTFRPDGEVAIEALDFVGRSSLKEPSATSFSGNNRDWYAIRFKNRTNRAVTIKFERGGWP